MKNISYLLISTFALTTSLNATRLIDPEEADFELAVRLSLEAKKEEDERRNELGNAIVVPPAFYDQQSKSLKAGWGIVPDCIPEFTADGMRLYNFHNLYKPGSNNYFGLFPACLSYLDGQEVTLMARVKTNVPNVYRMRIAEYAGGEGARSDSAFHSGNGQWETLKLTHRFLVHPQQRYVMFLNVEAMQDGYGIFGDVEIADVTLMNDGVTIFGNPAAFAKPIRQAQPVNNLNNNAWIRNVPAAAVVRNNHFGFDLGGGVQNRAIVVPPAFHDQQMNRLKDGWGIVPDCMPEFTADGMRLWNFHNLYKPGSNNYFGLFPACLQHLDGQEVTMMARVKTHVPNVYRMRITEYAGGPSWVRNDSDFHSGNGQWENLKLTHRFLVNPMQRYVMFLNVEAMPDGYGMFGDVEIADVTLMNEGVTIFGNPAAFAKPIQQALPVYIPNDNNARRPEVRNVPAPAPVVVQAPAPAPIPDPVPAPPPAVVRINNGGLDDAGVQKFYTEEPKPEHAPIYDEILAVVGRSKMPQGSKDNIRDMVITAQTMFRTRDMLLRNPPLDFQLSNAARGYPVCVHFENSVPGSYAYDRIPLNQRLNYFHNSLIQTYLVAKQRGNIRHWLDKAFNGGYCMDARSQGPLDYSKLQEKNKDTYLDFVDVRKKEGFNCAYNKMSDYIQVELREEDKPLNKENLQQIARRLVGLNTQDGPLTEADIIDFVDYCENILAII